MARAKVSTYLVEALVASDTASPTTVTGAGVSQYVLEVLVHGDGAPARLGQYVIEALFTENDMPSDPTPPGGVGTDRPRAFGYAG